MWALIMESKAHDNMDISILRRIESGLRLSDVNRCTLRPDGLCDICGTHIALLQREAIAMVQSLDRSQGGQVGTATIPTLDTRGPSEASQQHHGGPPMQGAAGPPPSQNNTLQTASAKCNLGGGEGMADPDNGNPPLCVRGATLKTGSLKTGAGPARYGARGPHNTLKTTTGGVSSGGSGSGNKCGTSFFSSRLPVGLSTDHQKNFIYQQWSQHRMQSQQGNKENQYEEPAHHPQSPPLQQPPPAPPAPSCSSPYADRGAGAGARGAQRPMVLPLHPHYNTTNGATGAANTAGISAQTHHVPGAGANNHLHYPHQIITTTRHHPGYHQNTTTHLHHQYGAPSGAHNQQHMHHQRGPYLHQDSGVGGATAGAPPGDFIPPPGTSAAASFFARAAQKLTMSTRKKRKHVSPDVSDCPPGAAPQYATNFCDIIRHRPPPAPPCLTRGAGRTGGAPAGSKVKVMVKVFPVDTTTTSFLQPDSLRKQVTLHDPSTLGYTTQAPHRKHQVSTAPKTFGFDAVFGPDDSLSEVCASALPDIVQAVVGGSDGCLFCYGHARLGKTYTMLGVDDTTQNLGILPCAIAWLFKVINDQKESSSTRFSVRVSAVEVTGQQERLKDLLADVDTGVECGSDSSPGVYLREDPICGTQLENQRELRAPTADKAALYLDAAIAARTVPEAEEDARNSHLLFTLHVYQYRLEKSEQGKDGVAGGRSRLHLIDLGSCSRNKDGNALSLSALGTVILALLNGQRHVPYRESKLTQLMRESLANFSCRTCLIAHVSPAMQAYNETLQVVQLAAKVHRMKRRRNKLSSASSDDSSVSGSSHSSHSSHRRRVGVRMGTLREDAVYTNALSASEHDYSSSSEQSCDTVIYVARPEDYSDGEYPPGGAIPRGPSGASPGVRFATPGGGSGDSSDPESRGAPRTVPKCGATMSKAAKIRAAAAAGKTYSSTLERQKKYVKRTLQEQSEPALKAAWTKSAYREGVNQEECWVDGPGAAATAAGVDRSTERWIDGPPEFLLDNQATPSPAPRRKKMWTEMNMKPAPPPRGVSLRGHHAAPAGGHTAAPHPVVPAAGHVVQHQGGGVVGEGGGCSGGVDATRTNQCTADSYHHESPPPPPQMVYGCAKTYETATAPVSHGLCEASRYPNSSSRAETMPRAAVPPCSSSVMHPGAGVGAGISGVPATQYLHTNVTHVNKTNSLPRAAGHHQHRRGDSGGAAAAQEVVHPSPSLPHRTVSSNHHQQQYGANPKSKDDTTVLFSGVNGGARDKSSPHSKQSVAQEKVTDHGAAHPPTKHVRHFVKDWVAVHSLPADEQTCDNREGVAREAAPHASPTHTAPVQTGERSSRHRHSRHHQNTTHSHSLPNSSHSTPRIKKKLKSALMSAPQKSSERVEAWVQSVQGVAVPLNEDPELKLSVSLPPKDRNGSPVVAGCLDDDEGPPPAYDTCVSDIASNGEERLSLYDEIEDVESGLICEETASLPPEKIWTTVEEVLSHHSSPERKHRGLNDAPDEVPDHQTQSDEPVLEYKSALLDDTEKEDDAVEKLLNSARESIYELQMEAEMETMSKTSTFASEDEHSTIGSLPRFAPGRKNAALLARSSAQISSYTSCIVDNEALSIDDGSSTGSNEALRDKPDMPATEDALSNEVSSYTKPRRPISLRRPDGASNPNLSLQEYDDKQNELDMLVPIEHPDISTRSVPGQCTTPTNEHVPEHCESEQPDGSQKSSSRPHSKSPHRTPGSTNSLCQRASSQSPKRGQHRASKCSKSPVSREEVSSVSQQQQPQSPTSKLPVKTSMASKLFSSKSKKDHGEDSDVKESKPNRGRGFLFRSRSSPSKSASPNKSSKSATSSPSKGFLCKREKSPKDKSKTSTPTASPEIGKVKSPSKQSAFAKAFGRKSSSAKESAKAQTTSSKSPKPTSHSPGKCKNSTTTSSSTTTSPMIQRQSSSYSKSSKLSHSSGRNTDSDSGNDSGIVRTDGCKKKTTGSTTKRTPRDELLSPYATVTNPRISTRSSSGHGSHFSDLSSTFGSQISTPQQTVISVKDDDLTVTTDLPLRPSEDHIRHHHHHHQHQQHHQHLHLQPRASRVVEMSSGYESFMHDSEGTGTTTSSSSGTQDSHSEGSNGGGGGGGGAPSGDTAPGQDGAVVVATGEDVINSNTNTPVTRRSRSAPAHPHDTNGLPASPADANTRPHTRMRAGGGGSKGVEGGYEPWNHQDDPEGGAGRMTGDEGDEAQSLGEDPDPLEITLYDVDDVERMQRRRREDVEHKIKENRKFRIRELLDTQEALKYELLEAKNMLMINHDTWSFDLYVAGQTGLVEDDQAYLDALEMETSILQKRVEACKSRIMMVTCFDVNNP